MSAAQKNNTVNNNKSGIAGKNKILDKTTDWKSAIKIIDIIDQIYERIIHLFLRNICYI